MVPFIIYIIIYIFIVFFVALSILLMGRRGTLYLASLSMASLTIALSGYLSLIDRNDLVILSFAILNTSFGVLLLIPVIKDLVFQNKK